MHASVSSSCSSSRWTLRLVCFLLLVTIQVAEGYFLVGGSGAAGLNTQQLISSETISEILEKSTLASLPKIQEAFNQDRFHQRQDNQVEQTRRGVNHAATKTSAAVSSKFTPHRPSPSESSNIEIHPQAWKDAVFLSSAATNSLLPSFTCATMPPMYTPYLFCSGVVDYPYYLMDGITAEDLNLQASTLGSYFSTYLNTQCLTNVKRNICASIYLPCVANVVPGDYSTYSPVSGFNVSIPYQRPCKSLCTSTTYLDTSCGGMLEAMGLGAHCDTSPDLYSGGMLPLYVDGTSPSSSCNALSTTAGIPLVAEQKEYYIGQVCQGIVSEYSVPPPSSLDPNFSPLLPPYVLQTITEMILSSVEGLIPRYLTSDCLVAQRALVCSSYFLKPEGSNALSFLFGEIYLPSFPHKSVCTRYMTECAYLTSLVPETAVDCDTVLPVSGIQLYPNDTQVIGVVDLGYGMVIPLTTEPNQLETMTFTLDSQCPYGFVVPEDATREGVVMAPGTACAAKCPLAIFRDSEYDLLYEQITISLLIALALTILQVVNLASMKVAKINIFVLSSIIGSLIYTVIQVLQVLVAPNTDALLCSSETSWRSIDDFGHELSGGSQYGGVTSGNLCVVTSFLSTFNNLFAYWILLAMAGEIWLRVAKGVKKVEGYRIYYLVLPALVLLTQFFVLTFYGEPDVLTPGGFSVFCSWGVSDPDLQYYLMGLPGTIYLCIALGLVIHSLYICVVTSLKVQDADRKPLKKIWKSYSMLFLFLALDLVLFPVSVFLFYTKWYYIDAKVYTESSLNWIACLFIHFTNESDTSYLTTCGDVPSVRLTPDAMLSAFLVTAYLSSFVMFYITLNREVKDMWWNVFITVTIYMGIRRLLNMLPYEWSSSLVDYLRYTTEKSTKPKVPGTTANGGRKSIVSSSNRSVNSSTTRGGSKNDDEDSTISSTWRPKGGFDGRERRDGIFLNLARLAKLRTPSMIRYAAGGNKMMRRSREIQVAVAPEHQELFDRIENNVNPPHGIVIDPAVPLVASSEAAPVESFVQPSSPPDVAKAVVNAAVGAAVAHIAHSKLSTPPAPMLSRQVAGGFVQSPNQNQSIAMIEIIRTKTRTDISAAVLNIFSSPITKASAADLEECGNEEPTTRMHLNDDDMSMISNSSMDDNERLPPV